MKTKIGMTFGLALMLAFGVVATMLAIGSFSTGTVEAGHGTVGTAGTTTDENVSSATWSATPSDPGAEAKVELVFTTYTQLDALTDTIIIEFEDDFDVPSVIDPSTVINDQKSNSGYPPHLHLCGPCMYVSLYLLPTPEL